MKILIIEDDKIFSNEIAEFCSKNQNTIEAVYDGISAIEKIDNNIFDMYIIDINLPSMNGLDIVKYIRSTDIDTPILVITNSHELEDIQKAYKYGCNEYMKKPFFLEELEIRVKNIINKQKDKQITFANDFYHNLDENSFYHKDELIELRYKEKRFCYLLIKNIGKVVKSSSIYDYVWENEIKDVYPLRQLVAELRKKLPINIIITKPKEGYLIEADILKA
ncbi:MAG: response regulator transcription factor [Campylobacterota bacterium]|nr:response regulator transcription factor [Campylobacterota bacterium]